MCILLCHWKGAVSQCTFVISAALIVITHCNSKSGTSFSPMDRPANAPSTLATLACRQSRMTPCPNGPHGFPARAWESRRDINSTFDGYNIGVSLAAEGSYLFGDRGTQILAHIPAVVRPNWPGRTRTTRPRPVVCSNLKGPACCEDPSGRVTCRS